jgi:hypothetical protein
VKLFRSNPVTPDFELPKVFRSRRQYVTWTKRARDVLVKYYRYSAEDFMRIGKSEPSIYGGVRYPLHWQTVAWHAGTSWLEYPPRGAVVYWPDGVDISSEAYDPKCPVDILADIQAWKHYNFPDPEEEPE